MKSNREALQNMSVAWVTPVLGVDGKLLYFGPLLDRLSMIFKKFCVYTAEFKGECEQARFPIIISGLYKRFYSIERHSGNQSGAYAKGFSFTGPGIIIRLIKDKPNLIIVNEFSLYSFYSLLAKYLLPKANALCVVEARPRITQGRILGITRKIFRYIMCQMADAFLTNNVDGKKYLLELGVCEKKIVCRPYLVSDHGCEYRKKSFVDKNNEKIVFLYVGQLLKRKGLQNAIKAADILKAAHPGRFILRIVGDGPYRAELEKLSQQCNLDSHVEFLGRQSYEELQKYYSNANVFIFPTLSDYRALSPFEALSYGLPILASREDGGVTETVNEGENGYSFDPNNPTEIADKMERIICDPAIIQKFSEMSRTIAEKYTLDNAIDAFAEASMLAIERKAH